MDKASRSVESLLARVLPSAHCSRFPNRSRDRNAPHPNLLVTMRGVALKYSVEHANCRYVTSWNLADVHRELDEIVRKIRHAKDREAALKLVVQLRRRLRKAKSLKDYAA